MMVRLLFLLFLAEGGLSCPISFDSRGDNQVCNKPALVVPSVDSLSNCQLECSKHKWCRYVTFKTSDEDKLNAPMQCSKDNKPITSTDANFLKDPENKETKCIAKNSVKNDCSKCLSHDQCETGGFCCPYMKLCVSSSSQGCPQPIANCRPPCHGKTVAECPACTNADYRSGSWQLPTCESRRQLSRASDKVGTIVISSSRGASELTKRNFGDQHKSNDAPQPRMRKGRSLDMGTGSVSEQDKSAFLQAHNKWRASTKDHTNMEYMAWDEKLQKVAQEHANLCAWNKNDNRDNDYQSEGGKGQVGENLAVGFDMSPTLSVDLWNDEGNDYAYGSGQCTHPSQCRHYIQAIWATSNRVGCGVAKCPTIANLAFGGTLIVCNYVAAAKFAGEKPYKTGDKPDCPPKTESQKYAGYGNLCAPAGMLDETSKRPRDVPNYDVTQLEKTNCYLSKECDTAFISPGWEVRSRVRAIPAIELVGEINYEGGLVGGTVVFVFLAVLFFANAHHALFEGRFSRQLDNAHRSGKFSAKFPSHLKHTRSRKNTAVDRTMDRFSLKKTCAYVALYVSQAVASIVVFSILFAMTDFESSWLSQWWISSHFLLFLWATFKLLGRQKCIKIGFSADQFTKNHTAICVFAFLDLSFVMLTGISAVTVSSIETKNFNPAPKTTFIFMQTCMFLTCILCCISSFLTYAAWHVDGAPDAGLGAELRTHRGKGDRLMRNCRAAQVLASIAILVLVAISPFFAMHASAIALCTISSVHILVASVQLSASILDKGKRDKYFGPDKKYFQVFLVFDFLSLVSLSMSALNCGDALKGLTAQIACILSFVLVFVYTGTILLLFLAVRGDLPSLGNLNRGKNSPSAIAVALGHKKNPLQEQQAKALAKNVLAKKEKVAVGTSVAFGRRA